MRWRMKCVLTTCVLARQMSKGDKAKCPKGGWPEYMNGPWYRQILGIDQGDRMREENQGKYGHGAFKDEPYRFTTIEQKLSGLLGDSREVPDVPTSTAE